MPLQRAAWPRVIGLTMTLLLLTSPALGAPILFTTRNVFDGVVGPHELVTFEEFPVGTLCLPATPFVSDPCSLTLKGATFSANTGLPDIDQRPVLIIESLGADPSKGLGSAALPSTSGEFVLTFGGPLIGLDVETFAGLGSPVTFVFTETDMTQTSVTIFAIGEGTFLGATSPVGFSQLSLFASQADGGRFNFLVDNVALGPVPEPATLLLVGTSAAGLGLARWVKKRRTRDQGDAP